ncbi:MAG: hypothetical protein AB7O98_17300 [Hyphomonadaceae bacterium]
MADVLLVCVRDDMARAEVLAEIFEDAGFSTAGAPFDEAALEACAASVVVVSEAALASPGFVAVAERAIESGTALIACLCDAPLSHIGDAPVFDLSRWRGEATSGVLDPLYRSVDARVKAARGAPLPALAARSLAATRRVALVRTAVAALLLGASVWAQGAASIAQPVMAATGQDLGPFVSVAEAAALDRAPAAEAPAGVRRGIEPPDAPASWRS